MFQVGIIERIEEFKWISPILMQEKKIRGIRLCLNLRKLNDTCIKDPFPTPFNDDVLKNLRGWEAYSFTHGFLGYHEIKFFKEDRHKTMFTMDLGLF